MAVPTVLYGVNTKKRVTETNLPEEQKQPIYIFVGVVFVGQSCLPHGMYVTELTMLLVYRSLRCDITYRLLRITVAHSGHLCYN